MDFSDQLANHFHFLSMCLLHTTDTICVHFIVNSCKWYLTILFTSVLNPVPENVTQLALVETTEDSISLTWDIPCGHTHGDILLFHYELSNENVPIAALTEGDSPRNATSLTINNLASCTPYEFRIKAKTSAGYGRYARLYHVRTQGEGMHPIFSGTFFNTNK